MVEIFDSELEHEKTVRDADFYGNFKKNSRFFFDKGKSNKLDMTMYEVELPTGQVLSDPLEVLDAQEKFYSQLYQTSQPESSLRSSEIYEEFFTQDHPVLSDFHQSMLSEEISQKEMLEALQSMPLGKAPGLDGFPVEFYKTFSDCLIPLLHSAIIEMFAQGSLIMSFTQGVIHLIPKPRKNVCLLANWRPITLLDVDYKILAKVLATRFKEVLPSIIHEDQRGFIQNKYIGENLMDFYAVVEYAIEHDEPILGLSLNFQKAFDTVEWSLLMRALQLFAFPESIQKWFSMIYTQCSV